VPPCPTESAPLECIIILSEMFQSKISKKKLSTFKNVACIQFVYSVLSNRRRVNNRLIIYRQISFYGVPSL